MGRDERKTWDRFSGIYDRYIKGDEAAYQEMIGLIQNKLKPDDRVLEIATGTGVIALELAGCLNKLEAVDLSLKMIEAAKRKAGQRGITNVHFSVQDALSLTYDANTFDVMVISNTLHIMPEPENALFEIMRILKPSGVLFAPTFIHAVNIRAAILSKLMLLTGFRAYYKWTLTGYRDFLQKAGFAVTSECIIEASFPLAYVEAVKGEVL